MLKLNSPAKVNLFLRVVGRRPDGYHELASLFQVVDLCDTLHVSLDKEDSLTCTDPEVPVDDSNLVLKAAELFRRETGLTFGVRVHLNKRIPSRSGLGGGSSNAATMLWALNHLLEMPVTTQELQKWSAEIGMDVPFFFSQGTAYATGRGEKLQQLPSFPSTKLTIFMPQQGLPTPVIYNRLRVDELDEIDPQVVLQRHLDGDPHYFNDLEEPAFAIYPQLALMKEKLLGAGFRTATMTGSGSAFFCVGQGEAPLLPTQVRSCAASFLNRTENQWYEGSVNV